jgi:hypothetical protein
MPSLASSVPSVPYSLLTFADLGHYNLFEKGILHRDVSPDTVMRYWKPVRCPALDKYDLIEYFASLDGDVFSRFDCTRNVEYCRGFLTDGNHAIRWRESTDSLLVGG